MDDISITASQRVTHRLELYTANRLINGSISAPFKRTSDMLNRKDRNFFTAEDVIVTPLSQPATTNRLDAPVTVGRSHIHLVAPAPGSNARAQMPGNTTPRLGEYHVKKMPFACPVLSGVCSIHGYCYMVRGGALETWLDT